MPAENNKIANFIIGGTEKSGTTSIFTYLSSHPDVCGSSVKETDFFRHACSGNAKADRAAYSRFFDHCNHESIVMEASPGYLSAGSSVAANIQSLVPNAKLLFILRDPIDRLYSSYNFHVNKLNIDEKITFESYIRKCMLYSDGKADPDELGIGEWYLKALDAGRYSNYLSFYYERFSESNIKVMFYEHLSSDLPSFMKDLCLYLGIDQQYFNTYNFNKINATYSGKNKDLHRIAMYVNEKSEKILRQRPALKQFLVKAYKAINQKQEGYIPMSEESRSMLADYYVESNSEIKKIISIQRYPAWLS